MSITKHTISILLALAIVLFTACRDEEIVMSSEATDGRFFISCQVADFVVTGNNATRAVADELAAESEKTIHKLDFLVFNTDGTCLCHLNSSSDQVPGRLFTTDTDGDATWDVTNLLSKDYLSNAAYTHVLVANCPDGYLSKNLTLTELKQLILNNTTFNPYAEQTAGIPMVQILESATGTRSEFNEATLTLTFNAIERVVAKVQVVTNGSSTNSFQIAKTIDFETEATYLAGWTIGANMTTTWAEKTDGSHYLHIKSVGKWRENTLPIDVDIFNGASEWKMEFDWASYNSNSDIIRLGIYYNDTDRLFYTEAGSWGSATSVYTSAGKLIGSFDADKHVNDGGIYDRDNANCITKWFHYTLIGSMTYGITLEIRDANNNVLIKTTKVHGFAYPRKINLQLGNAHSQMAIDNITFSYKPDISGAVSSYKLINYLGNGYLYNDDASTDYANDKRIDDASNRAFKNGFADGKVSLTDFNEWDTNSTMQGDNGFALYCYPNYWFDNEKFQQKYEGMHKYQPVREERQTYLLVKSKYIDQATGVLSSKEYYYKIPISSRLSEWNDIYTNSSLISDALCSPIIDAVWTIWETGVSSFDDFTDVQKKTVYETMQTQLSQATFPVYKDKDGNSLTTIETTTLHENLLKAILDALPSPASDGNITDDEKKNVINPVIRDAVAYGRIKEETEEYCRIQRNHHYIIYTSFDHAGGETADEAFYFATEPFYDVVLRPEF